MDCAIIPSFPFLSFCFVFCFVFCFFVLVLTCFVVVVFWFVCFFFIFFFFLSWGGVRGCGWGPARENAKSDNKTMTRTPLADE